MLTKTFTRLAIACWMVALLSACGGGGGGGGGGASSGGGQGQPPVATPAPGPSAAAIGHASRFAAQATFGLPFDKLEALAETSRGEWLDAQFELPVGYHRPVVDGLIARRNAGEFSEVEEGIELLATFRRYAWWDRTTSSSDALRQRVAFALSEIFVVSDTVDTLIVNPYALSTYYDVLLDGSFGSFRDLLRNVALHPAMGIYLSHVNNRKADPAANIFPDENFAREVMQLFTIGLFELNLDGSRRLDASGDPVPTYDNDDIREFAKIFTGLSYAGAGAFFGNEESSFQAPMQMFDAEHEPGEKRLLNGVVVPAGQSGIDDIEAALDNLFAHPNVGPFIGRQLIQRLVTSNPSPAYVERVAGAFNDNGSGVRGDMRAVVSAILLDPEAETPSATLSGGKLREPVVRFAALVRQLNPQSDSGQFFNGGYSVQNLTRQHPLSSPSVFNFFLPDHSPAGTLAEQSLVAPEFQITNATTIAGMTNLVDFAVNGDFTTDSSEIFGEIRLNYSEFIALAGDPPALVERLDLLFTYGAMAEGTKAAIIEIVADMEGAELRAKTAVYLTLISPDYAVRI